MRAPITVVVRIVSRKKKTYTQVGRRRGGRTTNTSTGRYISGEEIEGIDSDMLAFGALSFDATRSSRDAGGVPRHRAELRLAGT